MQNHALERSILDALEAKGASKEANKAYLEFIKANFIIPIEKDSAPESPRVLSLSENNETFLPVFSNREALDTWAFEIQPHLSLLTVSGVDLLKGVGENVTVCLNIGTSTYKSFNPQEIARMRSIILKFFKND